MSPFAMWFTVGMSWTGMLMVHKNTVQEVIDDDIGWFLTLSVVMTAFIICSALWPLSVMTMWEDHNE